MRLRGLLIAVAGIAALAGCAREPSSLQGSRSLDDLEQAIVELPTRYPPVARIVAIGDLHGDIEATDRTLRLAGAIDDEAHWAGGDLVVVQVGDEIDRGDHDREVLERFDRLAREANADGGAVFALLGNHELRNAKGRFWDVSPAGFAEFVDEPASGRPGPRPVRRERRGRWEAFRPGGEMARLLARRNVVVVIGDTVFAHGGVLPDIAAYGLERLNAETRWWLSGELEALPRIVDARSGPVWSRRYSDDPSPKDCATLATTLRILGASRMVVGHTVQRDHIVPACGGAVWRVDVGLSAYYGGPTEALEIAGGQTRVLSSVPLPN